MAPLDGSFRLAPAASTSVINSVGGGAGRSSSNTATTSNPPKAVFLRLTPAALQQLRSLNNNATGRVPGIGIEIGGGANNGQPTSLLIGESSYSISRQPATSINAGLVTDLIGPASIASAKGKGRASTASTPSSRGQGLSVLASGSKEQYAVFGAPVARKEVVKEKTAENMGERMRERLAQLEKEKESRKVVMVDDSALLPNGKKGKGKKANGPNTKAPASSLLRASAAIPAKRASSPAGVSPRNSPLLGASSATRPPNRLMANEAAKGLISRKEKERVEQQAKDASVGTSAVAAQPMSIKPAPTATSAIQSVPTTASSTGVTSDKQPEKVRVASSASSTSSYSSASASTQASNSTAASSIASMPVGPPPITKPTGMVSAAQARPGQPQRYHKAKVDESDLASASSSDEGDDLIPLAKRVNSPVKTVAPLPVVAPVQAKPTPPERPKAKPTATVAKKKVTPIKEKEPEKPPPQPTLSPLPPPPASLSVNKPKAPVSSASSRASSSDRSSASRSPPASVPANASKRKHEDVDPAAHAKPANNASATSLQVPEAKKPRTETAPRTQARTSGGTRLSKPLPRKSSGSSSTSPAPQHAPLPPVATNASSEKAVGSALDNDAATLLPTQSTKVQPSLSLNVTPAASPQRSRANSPLPVSPGGHPLPPKPSASAVDIALSKSPLLTATKLSTDSGRLSAPPSPVPSSRSSSISGSATKPAPPHLPAKPSTTMPPFGRSPSSTSTQTRTKSFKDAYIPAPPSIVNSPIVSDFSRRPLDTVPPVSRDSSASASKKRKSHAVADKQESAKKPKKSSKIDVAFTSSEEDGEADEDAEGEEEEGEDGEVSMQAEAEDSRGRSAEKKKVSASTTSTDPANQYALPSFSKKGRTSELSASEGKNGYKSQSVSRAQTPNSGDLLNRNDSPHIRRSRLDVSISSDSEFTRLSRQFSEDLFPAYSKLHRKLEDVQSNLKSSTAGKGAGISAAELAKMVEDANERGKELEIIKAAMQRYNQQKEKAARAVRAS